MNEPRPVKHKANESTLKLELVASDSPCLRTVCAPVPADPAAIAELVAPYIYPMKDILRAKRALGLAAPQVGIMRRFFLMVGKEGGCHLVINPAILKRSGLKVEVPEGCLSFPGRQTFVERDTTILVEWTTSMGERRTLTLKNQPAYTFQHELDHLDGKCIF